MPIFGTIPPAFRAATLSQLLRSQNETPLTSMSTWRNMTRAGDVDLVVQLLVLLESPIFQAAWCGFTSNGVLFLRLAAGREVESDSSKPSTWGDLFWHLAGIHSGSNALALLTCSISFALSIKRRCRGLPCFDSWYGIEQFAVRIPKPLQPAKCTKMRGWNSNGAYLSIAIDPSLLRTFIHYDLVAVCPCL